MQLVELYTTVLDTSGRPVQDLALGDFTVEEDGRKQDIKRFERVEESPIQVGVMIDNSASMRGSLGAVRRAALGFFQNAVRPGDRAAVITFNRFPNLAVELTGNVRSLGSGLAGLVPEGETALWDSVMYGLYYLAGERGQRALLILSDGRDEASTFSFDDTLDYARRAGVTLYTIALGRDAARGPLRTLAEETGGRFFSIDDADDLDEVYATVQRELRSQYLIAYQSSNTEDLTTFRRVVLEVDRPGVTVKTLAGYYPSRRR
ncbi:MAG: VWA domain-containing protein [Acidobacteriota bacterium]